MQSATAVDHHDHSGSEDGVPNGGVEEILHKLRTAPERDEDEDDSEGSDDLEGLEVDQKIVDFQAQRPSRLDGLEELQMLRQMLREAPAAMQQQVNTWIGGNLQGWLLELDSAIA
eukprot:symbB.v1.2.020880.t1/scaffold1780.1/size101567/4